MGISTIGLGIDFNEDLLFSIAKSGGGSYDFVDNPSQLASVFSDELDRSAALAGRQAVIDLDLGPGVEGVEVLGWAATRTDDGWRISLGDLPSSSTRRVVARVTVAAGSEGVFEGATARATWLDREGVAMAASDTSRIEATRSIAHADSSIIESVAGAAAYVYGNTLSMRSASAYASGDEDGAEGLLGGESAAAEPVRRARREEGQDPTGRCRPTGCCTQRDFAPRLVLANAAPNR